MNKLLLVSLPWVKPDHLSIQLGGLKAYLHRHDICAITRHYYKDILSYISEDTFYKLFYSNAGEYLSLSLLFQENKQNILSYLSQNIEGNIDIELLLKQFNSFINDVVSEMTQILNYHQITLVGFSTSLQQIITSLLVAQKIRKDNSKYCIVFGGAVLLKNIAIELLEFSKQIDLIIYGEGEEPLRLLVNSFDDFDKVPNLVFRRNNNIIFTKQKELIDISVLPIPDYSDYFNHSLSSESPKLYPKISIETSRGCFYGKCSFCNLNSQWISQYRSKDDEQSYKEICYLVSLYKTTRLLFVDSNISNRSNLFHMLLSDSNDYDGWAEVSGHLTRNTFKLMRKAGIRNIQIGIESFSKKLLKSFNKGITVMRNMELLKWSSEFDFNLFYNLIVGYPTENKDDVQDTINTMRFARYFTPPNLTPFVLSIESPIFKSSNFQNTNYNSKELSSLLIHEAEKNLLPCLLSTIVGYESKLDTDWTHVSKYVDEWNKIFKRNHSKPSLLLRHSEDFIVLTDRSNETERHIILEGNAAKLYNVCMDESRSFDEIKHMTGINSDEIKNLIFEMEEKEIMFISEDRYLALGIIEDRWCYQ